MSPRRGEPMSLRDRIGWRLLVESRRLGILPAPILRPLGQAAGRASLLARRRRMRRTLLNLTRAFPDWPKSRRLSTAWASGAHLGEVWADWLRLSHLAPEDRMARVDVSSLEEPVRNALEARTGAIIATGFLGYWEGLAAALSAATGEVMIVIRRNRPSLRRDVVDKLRHACAVRTVSFSAARIDAARWLRLNRLVIFMADGDAGREGVFLPFFGVPAPVTDLPVRLAADTGAPLLAAFCLKAPDGRWRTRAEAVPVGAGADAAERAAAMERWTVLLEAAVREHPEQYVWNHRRWRTRPSRASALPGGPP